MKDQVRAELKAEIEEQIGEPDTYVEMNEDLEMVPIREGQIIRLNNIFFKANKFFLLPESKEELDRVVRFLNSHPELVVEVAGHTNGLPSSDFCNELSNNRSKEVMKYLLEKGVPRKQMSYRGYGKTQPIATNETLEGRKKNQRVELRIISVE